MTTDKIAYSASTALTITLTALASSATVGRQATVVDNSVNLYDDVLVTLDVTTSASALANDLAVYVYVSGSEDGTNFTQDDGVMGASDAAYTVNNPSNLAGPVAIYCPTSSKVYNKIFSVAQMFAGVMPRKWTIVVVNYTGQNLGTSSATMTGITYTNS